MSLSQNTITLFTGRQLKQAETFSCSLAFCIQSINRVATLRHSTQPNNTLANQSYVI